MKKKKKIGTKVTNSDCGYPVDELKGKKKDLRSYGVAR